MIPIITRIRPTAKVILPNQSIFPPDSVPFGIAGTLWAYFMLKDTKDTKSGGKIEAIV